MRNLALCLVIACLATVILPAWAEEAPPPTPASSPAAPTAPGAPIVPTDASPVVDRKRLLPTVGRIVYFVLDGDRKGEIRPATIVRVNGEGEWQTCNLSVLLDGPNDPGNANVRWVGSARHDQETQMPGTWHWMEYQMGQAAKGDGDVAALRNEIGELRGSLHRMANDMATTVAAAELAIAAIDRAIEERRQESARAGAAEGRERDLRGQIETMERDAKHGHRS